MLSYIPIFYYLLPLWGSTFPTYLTKLQRLQNKALRIIFNCKQHDSLTSLFHKLEILNIRDLYHFKICKLMYLHSKKLYPIAFLIFLSPPRQFIVKQQDPNHKTTSSFRNTQLLDVEGRSSFKV